MTQIGDESLQPKRRKRIDRLKKIIVGTILAFILIPTAIAACLGVRVHTLKKQLYASQQQADGLQAQLDKEMAMVESYRTGIALANEREAAEANTGTDSVISETENSEQDVIVDENKHVYLTFDDGPSTNTAEILDILAEYNVKATFFVTGDTDEQAKAIYRRIVEEGHTIGVHSYSHRYQEIYASEEAFFEDFYLMSDYIYDVTGVRPVICRLPGGSSNTVSRISMADIVQKLESQGVNCYDWNISGKDAEGHNLTAEQIALNVLSGVNQFQTSVVLLHDGKGKSVTPEALRMILDDLTGRENIQIETITEETPIILHITH